MRVTDINILCESLKEKVPILLKNINARLGDGIEVAIFETYRSPSRQLYLYKKGRSKLKYGKHCEGKAVDFVVKKNGNWTWDMKDERVKRAYFIIGEEAVKLGLQWGGNWKTFKDYVHVQVK